MIITITVSCILAGFAYYVFMNRPTKWIVGEDGMKYRIPPIVAGWIPWVGVGIEYEKDGMGLLRRLRYVQK
jgi:hypothetical protein